MKLWNFVQCFHHHLCMCGGHSFCSFAVYDFGQQVPGEFILPAFRYLIFIYTIELSHLFRNIYIRPLSSSSLSVLFVFYISLTQSTLLWISNLIRKLKLNFYMSEFSFKQLYLFCFYAWYKKKPLTHLFESSILTGFVNRWFDAMTSWTHYHEYFRVSMPMKCYQFLKEKKIFRWFNVQCVTAISFTEYEKWAQDFYSNRIQRQLCFIYYHHHRKL